jgi:mRNA interferase RelE/StbE
MIKIEVTPAAERDLRKLKNRMRWEDFESILAAIGKLKMDPRPQGVLKIKGAEDAYRIRSGGYRIIYKIFDKRDLVVLLNISRRSETTYR